MVVVQNKGYTIPELIVVIVIVGIFSILAINKVSYAFVDNNVINEETEDMILTKISMAYANNIIETLKVEDQYITGKELLEMTGLSDDGSTYANAKIKLSYNKETNSASVEILK